MAQEIFDVVDEEDRIIGEARRDQVHGNPSLIHRVVHVLVFNRDHELYLQKRSRTKDVQPGKWDTSVGGHVDKGETYGEAAVREMEEELGIKGEHLDFLYKYRHCNEFESEFVSTYSCLWDGAITLCPEEIETGGFWNLYDIAAHFDTGIFTPNFLDEITRYQDHLNPVGVCGSMPGK